MNATIAYGDVNDLQNMSFWSWSMWNRLVVFFNYSGVVSRISGGEVTKSRQKFTDLM